MKNEMFKNFANMVKISQMGAALLCYRNAFASDSESREEITFTIQRKSFQFQNVAELIVIVVKNISSS